MSKHTPGPWKVSYPNIVTTKSPKPMLICSIPVINQEANARLIASAPELLEALSRIITNVRLDIDLYEGARQAIAKAKGGDK